MQRAGGGRADFGADLGKVSGFPLPGGPGAIVILELEHANSGHSWESDRAHATPDCPAVPALPCIAQAERKIYNQRTFKSSLQKHFRGSARKTDYSDILDRGN